MDDEKMEVEMQPVGEEEKKPLPNTDAVVDIPAINDDGSFSLIFEDIACTVNGSSILNGVSGYCHSGQSLAILGSSGAGKTTLLDILAFRKKIGTITGSMSLNGSPINAKLRRLVTYISSETTHVATLTCMEAMLFAANLRLPELSLEERQAKINSILEELKIAHIGNSRIGNELVRGVSTGERKRLDLALELLCEPRVLFMDEPTSGLDATAARVAMDIVLQSCKRRNVATIVVIHQPSTAIFKMFDSCLLLSEGRAAYFGQVSEAPAYFGAMNKPIPALTNPVDHYMNVIAEEPVAICDRYLSSDLHSKHKAALESMKKSFGDTTIDVSDLPARYASPFYRQFYFLLLRHIKRYARNPSASVGRWVIGVLIAIVYGAVFYNLPDTIAGFRLRGNLAAFIGFLPAYLALTAVSQFQEDRELYFQEHSLGYYSSFAFYISYAVVESSLMLVLSLLQVPIIYFMAGLLPQNFGAFYGMILVQTMASVAVAQFSSTWSKNVTQAVSINLIYNLLSYYFSGVSASLATIPYWLRWVPYIDFWRYSISFILFQQLEGFVIHCAPSELVPGNLNSGELSIATLNALISSNISATFGTSSNPTDQANVKQGLLALLAAGETLVTGQTLTDAWTQGFGFPDFATVWDYHVANLYPQLTTLGQACFGAITGPDPIIPASLNASSSSFLGGLPFAEAVRPIYPNASLNWVNASGAELIADLFNGPISFLADQNTFPDFSYCYIQDTAAYISSMYGIGTASTSIFATPAFGPMFAFIVGFMAWAYVGLLFSKRFKRR